jgi:hypothetical protein
MNLKDVEGRGGGLILRYNSGICLEGLRQTTKTSVRISGLRAEIWTRDLQNMKQLCSSLNHDVWFTDLILGEAKSIRVYVIFSILLLLPPIPVAARSKA